MFAFYKGVSTALALWCMFAQTVPAFQDASRWMVHSTSSKAIADAAIQQGYVAADGYTALAEPGIYLYDHSYKKDKTQSLQDRAVFRPGVLSENKDTGKIGRMNAVPY